MRPKAGEAMTYRCGIGPGLERLDLPPGPPRVRCDGLACEAAVVIREGRAPPAWLLDNRAPPGWRRVMRDGVALHYCPQHKSEAAR